VDHPREDVAAEAVRPEDVAMLAAGPRRRLEALQQLLRVRRRRELVGKDRREDEDGQDADADDARHGPGARAEATSSTKPDARIESRVHEIDEQVRDDHDHRGNGDERLDDRHVLPRDRLHREPAHTRVREDRLGDHGAAQQEADLQPRAS
jgi:hypothetical protein